MRATDFSAPLLLAALVLLLPACSTNPVTGKSEMSFISEQQELKLGKQQYMPSRQQQGGDYVSDPGVTRYVQSVGKKLAKVADRKLPYEFVVINDSVPNAWALPAGKIAVNRGLLVELDSEAELAAVLGHEIVHSAARHSAQQMERSALISGAAVLAGVLASQGDRNYGALATTTTAVGGQLLNQHYGRDAEREADYYGIKYMTAAGYDPTAAVRLQETFVRLSKQKNPGWLSGLFSSHPPSQERVDNNRAQVAKIRNHGGFVGAEKYQRNIATLLKTKDAYKAYDDGVVAVQEDNSSKALKLANKAIREEPREALFYSLRGDAYFMRKNWDKAYASYDKAVSLNSHFYRFYLERGLTELKRGNKASARRDFESSNRLLPTKTAKRALDYLGK